MGTTFDYGVSGYTEKALVETLNDLVQHVENEVVEFKLAGGNFDLKNFVGSFLGYIILLINFVVLNIKKIQYLCKN